MVTGQPTDRPTDTPSYRDARTQLKTQKWIFISLSIFTFQLSHLIPSHRRFSTISPHRCWHLIDIISSLWTSSTVSSHLLSSNSNAYYLNWTNLIDFNSFCFIRSYFTLLAHFTKTPLISPLSKIVTISPPLAGLYNHPISFKTILLLISSCIS